MERGLRVVETDKTFFKKITNTIGKLLIPTKVGFNSVMISIKRNNVIKAYLNYEGSEKDENIRKKYEDTYSLYLESIDKYIMDSIYKKVKNDTANEFERNALANYYEVTHLKENEYLEYKYKKQKYLIDIDYQNVKDTSKGRAKKKYEMFYASKMDTLYKGLLKHYSVKITDNITYRDKEEVYNKIFNTLEDYIDTILPIKIENERDEYKEVIEQYEKFEGYTVGKLDQKELIEKKSILLGISRQLFTHSVPLVVAEHCYVKLLKETRDLIVDTKIAKKKEDAYVFLLDLIEEYNKKLLSTKIYWDIPSERDEYKKFWNEYKDIQKLKEENEEEYKEQREILFIRNDLKKLQESKNILRYEKIINFYKEKLVEKGAMRILKNSCKTFGTYTKKVA